MPIFYENKEKIWLKIFIFLVIFETICCTEILYSTHKFPLATWHGYVCENRTYFGDEHVWGKDTFEGWTRFGEGHVSECIFTFLLPVFQFTIKTNLIIFWCDYSSTHHAQNEPKRCKQKTNVFVYGMVIVRTNLVSHRKVMGSFTNPLLLQKPGICKYCDFVNYHVLLH